MTAAERKVKAVHPCADCGRSVLEYAFGKPFRVREWWPSGTILGEGQSRGSAWRDAASRIPVSSAIPKETEG